jgi:hypothetical protein
VLEDTVDVEIVNAALVAPAGIVTVAGTDAAGSLLDSATVAPPAGAGAVRVTNPLEELPPCTAVGFTDTESRAAIGVAVVSKTTSTQ